LIKVRKSCWGILSVIRYMLRVGSFIKLAKVKWVLRTNKVFNFFDGGSDICGFVRYPAANNFFEIICSKPFVDADSMRRSAFMHQILCPLPIHDFKTNPKGSDSTLPTKCWTSADVDSAFENSQLRKKAMLFLKKMKSTKIMAITLYSGGQVPRALANEAGEVVLYEGYALVGGTLAGPSFEQIVITVFPSVHAVLSFVSENKEAFWLENTHFATLKLFDP